MQLPNGAVQFEATVRFVNLEGGCWLLDAVGGQRFEPVALPEALRRDGLRVRVTVRDFDGGSICMMGRLVTVDSAEAM